MDSVTLSYQWLIIHLKSIGSRLFKKMASVNQQKESNRIIQNTYILKYVYLFLKYASSLQVIIDILVFFKY